MNRSHSLLLTLIGVIALVATAVTQAQSPNELATLIDSKMANGKLAPDRTAIEQLYFGRQQLVWLQNSAVTRQGSLLLQTLRSAGDFGLRPGDYNGTQLTYRALELSKGDLANRGSSSAAQAELDLDMSIAAVRFVRHLHFGRIDPRAAGFNLTMPRVPFDMAGAIEQLAASDNFAKTLEGIEPPFSHYQILKHALQRYRLLSVDRELTDLPDFPGRSIKPGDPYIGIPVLRRLLVALDDLPADVITSDTVLDDALANGIKHFQLRHGLGADGAFGRRTFAALRTPLSDRVQQLAFTLERWRWLPEFTSPPIIVNIPQFRLFAFRATQDRAADILQMDVIVGKTYPTTRTPVFTADMKYVVFRPYWDVPPSIVQKEMLPEIRIKPNYFEKNNLEIVSSTDANSPPIAPSPEALEGLTRGTLRLRQRPGDDNALGLVKLMLPNSYNVYLHSTPAQRLFTEPRRAFSHGCIRVSDPVGLVEHVLRNEPGNWTREKIEAAMHDESPGGNNRHVFLSKPISVLIVYGTAIVLENGDVQFFEDIYGHDAKLATLLEEATNF